MNKKMTYGEMYENWAKGTALYTKSCFDMFFCGLLYHKVSGMKIKTERNGTVHEKQF